MAKEIDYFKAFCKLSRAFGTAATQDDLLGLIVQHAIDTMEGKASCLFLADQKQDLFIPVVQKGLSASYLHANPMKVQRLVNVLLENGYLSFLDATTDERLENHAAKKAEGIASILTVPVMVQDRPIGVLSLYTSTRREFTTEEIDFLRALAEQGGMAIEKARLLERLQENAMLLLELATSMNSTLDIKSILDNLTDEVSEALHMKGADIRLLNQESHVLELVASYGLSEEFVKKSNSTVSNITRLALKGETLTSENIETDDRIQGRDALKNEGIGALIISPIKVREAVIGTLRLYSDIPRNFPSDMVDMVKALAYQGGLAIQNASLYLKLQEEKKNLEEDIWSHRAWF